MKLFNVFLMAALIGAAAWFSQPPHIATASASPDRIVHPVLPVIPVVFPDAEVTPAPEPIPDELWTAEIARKRACDCGCAETGVCTCANCPDAYQRAYKAGKPFLVYVRCKDCPWCDRLAVQLQTARYLLPCPIVEVGEEDAQLHKVTAFPTLVLYNAPRAWRHAGYMDAASIAGQVGNALTPPAATSYLVGPTVPAVRGIAFGQACRSCGH